MKHTYTTTRVTLDTSKKFFSVKFTWAGGATAKNAYIKAKTISGALDSAKSLTAAGGMFAGMVVASVQDLGTSTMGMSPDVPVFERKMVR